jgi:hypothetical protein
MDDLLGKIRGDSDVLGKKQVSCETKLSAVESENVRLKGYIEKLKQEIVAINETNTSVIGRCSEFVDKIEALKGIIATLLDNV